MKYFIGIVIVLVLIFGGYWAGTKQGDDDAQEDETPIAEVIVENEDEPRVSTMPISGVVIGNRIGNRAPDFRLKDTDGNNVALRDFIGHEEIRLVFAVSGQIMFQGRTLLDPDNAVHRLYGITSMPTTVKIDVNGIIY